MQEKHLTIPLSFGYLPGQEAIEKSQLSEFSLKHTQIAHCPELMVTIFSMPRPTTTHQRTIEQLILLGQASVLLTLEDGVITSRFIDVKQIPLDYDSLQKTNGTD